jgi:D-proline reductase (dithiol) PrdB
MCNQTIGLVQAEIEKQGISTISISLLQEITEKVAPPRAIAVPFKHGFPLGKPKDPKGQTLILKFMIQSLMENEMKPPWIQNLTF